jgi:hypothetical protein
MPEPNTHAKSHKSEPKQSLLFDGARDYPNTAGERIHNEITYRGVDWIANTAVAVGFAIWSNRTHSGQNWFAKPVTNGFEKILRPITKDAATANEWAEHGTTFASIMVGGTIIIPPMMLLDKNRLDIVEYFDRKIYGDSEVDNNERFAVRYEAMEHRPSKGFWTGMGARLGVLTPMLWGHMRYNKEMNRMMYQPIAKASKGICKTTGIKPNTFMNERFHGAQDQTTWDFMHTTLGMDLGLTFIYSYAHEWAYKGLTKLIHGGTEEPQRSYAANTNAAPSSEVSAADVQLRSLMQAPANKAVAHG